MGRGTLAEVTRWSWDLTWWSFYWLQPIWQFTSIRAHRIELEILTPEWAVFQMFSKWSGRVCFVLPELIFQENFQSLRRPVIQVDFSPSPLSCHSNIAPHQLWAWQAVPSTGLMAHGDVLEMAVCNIKRLNCLFNSEVTNYLISTYAICLHSCDHRY